MSAIATTAPLREPTRARYPDDEGFIERNGVRVFWESYGEGPPLLLTPSWSIVPSRVWKAQIPYLARSFKVVVFDGRGNGRSDRPLGRDSYDPHEFTLDALAVMDATGVERAAVLGASRGAQWTLELASDHPDRVMAAVFVASALPLTPWPPFAGVLKTFEEPRPWRRKASALRTLGSGLSVMRRSRSMRLFARSVGPFEGAEKFSAEYFRREQADFVDWFAKMVCTEPHSTRLIEQVGEWGMGTDPATLADSFIAQTPGPREIVARCRAVECPTLVIHGTDDLVTPFDWGEALAAELGTRLLTFEGAGHAPGARQPVRFNLALREFLDEALA